MTATPFATKFARGGEPEIPTRRNRLVQHSVNQLLYATRNRIERFFNRLKNSRRVATRYDHAASSFLGFAKFASIRQWIRFVHAAQIGTSDTELPAFRNVTPSILLKRKVNAVHRILRVIRYPFHSQRSRDSRMNRDLVVVQRIT